MMPRITVVGGVAIDRLATTSTGAAITGASNPGRMITRPGGVGFSVATILAALGHPTRLLARVGDDDDGRSIVNEMNALGMTTTGITTSSRQPTGTYTAVFDGKGDLVIGVADLALYDDFLPEAIEATSLSESDTDFCVLDANLAPEMLGFVCERAQKSGVRTAALTVSPMKAMRLVPCLPSIGWLITNRAEASALLGIGPSTRPKDAVELASALRALGPGSVIVTDGPRPVGFANDSGDTSVALPPVRVAGVNGAGDSLAAGTIHGLAGGQHWTEALEAGIAAAALTLEHGGVRAAGFSAARLSERINLNRQDREL
jgi:pseudouridine kinase